MNNNNLSYFMSPIPNNINYTFQNNYQEDNDSNEKEIDNYLFSPKQSFFNEKIQTFKEKDIDFQEDRLNFDGNNCFAPPPLTKEKYVINKVHEISFFDPGKSVTKASTGFLGNKTKRKINEIDEKFQNKNLEKIKIIKNENIFFEKTKNTIIIEPDKKPQGRKKKDKLEKGYHTKTSEDNIMRKIKTSFINFFHNLLNKSLKDKNLQFLKLDSKISENLKKDFNIELLNTKLKYLYYKTSISTKYRKQIKNSFNKNKLIIKKIYEDKKENETIKILNLTIRDLFNIFIRKIRDIDYDLQMKIKDINVLDEDEFNKINIFFDEIERQEIKKNESKDEIEDYIYNIKNLCLTYEEWYANKRGRNRTKKNE